MKVGLSHPSPNSFVRWSPWSKRWNTSPISVAEGLITGRCGPRHRRRRRDCRDSSGDSKEPWRRSAEGHPGPRSTRVMSRTTATGLRGSLVRGAVLRLGPPGQASGTGASSVAARRPAWSSTYRGSASVGSGSMRDRRSSMAVTRRSMSVARASRSWGWKESSVSMRSSFARERTLRWSSAPVGVGVTRMARASWGSGWRMTRVRSWSFAIVRVAVDGSTRRRAATSLMRMGACVTMRSSASAWATSRGASGS